MSRTPDRDRLLSGIVHIRYTIDQLIASLLWHLREKESPWDGDVNAVFRNAYLESSLLNLRILDEFFTRGGNKNRIKAHLYADFKLPRGVKILDQQQRQKLNDYLAHLTWARVDGGHAEWAHAKIYGCLPHVITFLTHLLDEFFNESDGESAAVQALRDSLQRFLDFSKPA